MGTLSWTIATVAALALYSWFATWTGFYVVSGYKRAEAEQVPVPFGGRFVAIVWFCFGAPGDVLYNAIIGSWRFREAPKWGRREWTYSARIQRLCDRKDPADWRYQRALSWAYVLNAIAPGHIEL